MAKKESNLKKNVKKSGNLPALKIMGGVVGAATLISVGVILMDGNKDGLPEQVAGQAQQTSISSVAGKVNEKYVPGTEGQGDERYKKLLKESEKQRMEEARENKQSYISAPDLSGGNDELILRLKEEIERLKLELEQTKLENSSLKNQINTLTMSAQNQAPTVPYYRLKDGTVLASQEVVRERDKQAYKIVDDIFNEPLVSEARKVSISNKGRASRQGNSYEALNDGTMNNQAQSTSQQAPGNYPLPATGSTGAEDHPKSLIHAGSMLYATLDMTANSDVPGPIIATLHEGPYAGAKLMGGFEKQGDYLVMSFNKMVLPDGRVKSISAVAVDPVMMTVAQGDELDRHIPSKLAAVFGAAWLKGIGSAFLESGRIQTADGSGQSVLKESALDSAGKIAMAGLADVGKALAEMLAPYAKRPDTVIKYANTDMAVLFLNTVK